MTKRITVCLVTLGLLAGAATVLADGGHSFYGRVKSGPTFDRPNYDGLALSGRNVYYTVQPFYVSEDSNCWIRSVQWDGMDGAIFLYQDSFDPANPLADFVAGDDDGDTGIGTSEIANVPITWANNWYLVTTTHPSTPEVGNYIDTVECESSVGAANDVVIITGDWGVGIYDGRRNLLNNGRFRVEGTWDTGSSTGDAYFVPLGSIDSGFLWFFNPTNWEVLIKVLNGCAINNRYWVYMAATTDVEYHITVRDMLNSLEVTYDNTLGNQSPAFTDSSAFATCP